MTGLRRTSKTKLGSTVTITTDKHSIYHAGLSRTRAPSSSPKKSWVFVHCVLWDHVGQLQTLSHQPIGKYGCKYGSEPSRLGTKLVCFTMFVLVADPKDWENANIRIPLCTNANCGNSAVFHIKFRRHQNSEKHYYFRYIVNKA
jgi:hypothetical protein